MFLIKCVKIVEVLCFFLLKVFFLAFFLAFSFHIFFFTVPYKAYGLGIILGVTKL